MRCFLLFYGAIWYNTVKELLHTPPANTLPIAEGQTEFIVICYNNKRTIISSPGASSLNHLRCLIQGAVKKSQYLERSLSHCSSQEVKGTKSGYWQLGLVSCVWVLFQGDWNSTRKTFYLWKVCENPAPKSPSQPDKLGHGERVGTESSTLKTSFVALSMGFLLWNKK